MATAFEQGRALMAIALPRRNTEQLCFIFLPITLVFSLLFRSVGYGKPSLSCKLINYLHYITLNQFLCLHIVLCCLCITIATTPCFWLYCCIFSFLGCMYMPVCTQDSLADQPHIWAEGTACWKIKSTTTTTNENTCGADALVLRA